MKHRNWPMVGETHIYVRGREDTLEVLKEQLILVALSHHY